MAPEECIKSCCVTKCINTSLNSKVNFFNFPEARCRSFLRNKWVRAITNERRWKPNAHSFVCSDHFVKGQPSTNCQDIDYVPSVFNNNIKGGSIKSRVVSVKKFALEYIQHDALLEKLTRANACNDKRKRAYTELATTFGIPTTTVRVWERRFRDYFKQKMKDPPDKRKPTEDGKPHWLTTVAQRLLVNPLHSGGGAVSPGGVVATLCAAARARDTLCSTALYNDVRRALRLSSTINELHAIWVSAQRVSLQQVLVAGRAGDAAHAAPPAAAAEVADLVLLHTDVDIITDESVTLYEESAALHTLWQLVQRHRLEDAAPAHSRVRAQRWTRAHRSYLDSGRKVSLIVLQRRWYELKLQARVRLAMHWRRPPAPQIFDDLTPAPDPVPDPVPDAAPDPAPTPHDQHPRPAPLHIAILKRYPHIATGQFKTWQQQVSGGTIVTEPLEEDNDVNEQSTDTTDTGNDAAVKQLYPNTSKVEQPTVDEPIVEQPPDSDPLTEGPTDTDLLEEENYVKEIQSNNNGQSTDTADTGNDAVVKQLYSNTSKVEQPTVVEPMVEQPPDNDPLTEGPTYTDLLEEVNYVKEQSNNNEQSSDTTDTANDAAVKQLYPNMSKVEQPTVDEPMVEQPPDSDPLTEGPTHTELLEEKKYVKETQSNNNEQSTDITDTANDAGVKQLYPNMSKVEQPTVDEPMVEQPPDNDPLTEEPTHTGLLEEKKYVKETQSNNNEQSTDITATANDAAVRQLYPNMSKVEQPTVDEPTNEQTIYDVPLVELSTVDDHLAQHTTDNDILAMQRTVDDPLPEQTTDSDLLAVQSPVDEPKIVQGSLLYELLFNQSTECTHAESPVGHVGNAATANTQGKPDISSEQIQRAEAKSNEVIPPTRAYYNSDTDTDIEDNLIIDECSNKTPCSLKREPVPHTETHSFDTVSPHAPLGNIAPTPTIEVLHMIDPNTVKTEILFESDEDDFQPCNEVDNDEIELGAKNEVSFSNRIMFVDEEPGVSCAVKSEHDVTNSMDWEDGEKMDDPVDDTPTIDPKLLMDTQVRIFRIDKTRAWKKNVRKDNSIRVSRIHRRYYTPKPKITKTQNTPWDLELRTLRRLNTTTNIKTQEIRVDKSCLDQVANTHSIKELCKNIKRELLDEQLELLEGKTPHKKAKTESDSEDDKPLLVLREEKPQRESTEETEDTFVREMVEESSSDEELLNDEMIYEEAVANKLGGEKRRRGAYYAASTIEWNSDFAKVLGRVAKRVSLPDIEQVRRYNSGIQVAQVAPITSTVGAYSDDAMHVGQPPGDAAADDTPEAAAAAPAQHAEPGRLDDAGVSTHVASHTKDLPTFQGNRDMPYGLFPSSRDKSLAWSALVLPADDELQAALDDLTTTAPAADMCLARSHCCAARRHREVNDTRRRIGLDEIPLHSHPDGVCVCCCAHLSDANARLRLDQQLRALHEDIERMLRKSAEGKIQSKPAQKHTRSPSPARASTSATTATAATSTHKQATSAHKQATSTHKQATSTHKQATSTHKQATSTHKQATSAHKQASSAHKQATSTHKQATKDAPSNTATETKESKAKPATYTNRSKQRRSRARAPPTPEPAPPAPPINDYEEWQRQKNMNAKYFHINGNVSSKKDKSTTAQGTAEQSTIAQVSAVQRTTAQGPAVKSTITQATDVQSSIAQATAVQMSTAQGTAVQSSTAQGTAVQSSTAQGTAVQSSTAQGTAVQSSTVQGTAVQSSTAQGTAVQSSTAQGTAVQSSTAQGTAVQSTTAQGRAMQIITVHGTTMQNTTAQTVTKQNTFTENARPQQNVVQPGLMPYIRRSRLITPLNEHPRARRAITDPPVRSTRFVNIAPKPNILDNIVVNEPVTTKEDTKNITIQNFQPRTTSSRRMNLTTEQVSEPTQPLQAMTVISEPTDKPKDKPVSILEEYSRTLSIEPVNNTPVVNALSLRVPSGPQGPKTTIVMALTLPSDDVIQQTIKNIYANDTVDLTKEPETSNIVITKTGSKHQTTTPFDLLGAVKTLVYPVNKNKSGRSLLKPVTPSNTCKSVLKSIYSSAFDKPSDTTKPPATITSRNKVPTIMSLYNQLHDGDVIEIDDTDSNNSNNSDGNQSSNSNKNSILINKNSNPAVYSNKGSNQTINKTAESSNQAGNNTNSSNETVSKTNENSSQDYIPDWNSLLHLTNSSDQATEDKNKSSTQASTANSTNQAIDKDKSSVKPSRTKKGAKERYKNSLVKRRNVSDEAVSSHSVARPCSRIPVLTSLTDGSRRCPARFANVAAMTDFMATLRRAAAQADKEVYCHKWSAIELPVSALPCGGTLLCVDGSRPPLILRARDWAYQREERDRAKPHPRAHLVVTDADPPCALPTYWTMASFGQMSRVVPDELLSTDAPDTGDAQTHGGGVQLCEAREQQVPLKENKKICEKNHNFKILTAFCSADGVRQAARAGASLLLLSVLRARVVVLTLQRSQVRGVVRHRASADVEEELLRELEGLLDEAEIDEELGGRADTTDQ